MTGPWEQYARPAAPAGPAGPWTQYARQPTAAQDAQQPPVQRAGVPQWVNSTAGNLLGGAVRGAGSIGATLLAPVDMIGDALDGKGLSLQSNRERRQAVDEALRMMGADTDSAAFAVGKFGTELAGTLPLGGLLAKGLTKVAPGATAAADALATAGGSAGSLTGAKALATRAAGGAGGGGATALVVDPDSAAAGAALGAVMPPAFKAFGAGANLVWGAAQPLMQRGQQVIVGDILRKFSGDPARAAQALEQAATLVPGSKPGTAALTAAAGLPGLSGLQRAMAGLPDFQNRLTTQRAANHDARRAALGAVAPLRGDAITAAEDAGQMVRDEAAQHMQALKGQVSAKYGDPALKSVTLLAPDSGAARSAVQTFYPGLAYDAAAPADLRQVVRALGDGQTLPLAEFDKLRSLAGARARDLADTDRHASAAWGAVKRLFDDVEQAAEQRGREMTFKVSPGGSVDWGVIGDEAALAAGVRPGPIRLPEGNAKFGAQHLQRDHRLKSIAAGGYPSPEAMVADVAENFTAIHAGKNGSLILTKPTSNSKSGLLWVEVAEGADGAFHQVNSGVAARADYTKGKPLLWERAQSNQGALRQSSPSAVSGQSNGLAESVPDLEASFNAFKASLTPKVATPTGMSPDAAQVLRDARSLNTDLERRFRSGPAQQLWQTGSDQLPRAQGAEVARGFFNAGADQAARIASLNDIVLAKGPGTQAMRSYAITDLVEKASTQAGMSPDRFQGWVKQRAQALKGLFTDEQIGRIQTVLADLQREAAPDVVGRAPGSNTAQNLSQLWLLGKSFGSLGESQPVQQTLGRLLKLGYRGSDEQAQDLLGQAMLDPALAARLMRQAQDYRVPLSAIGDPMSTAAARAVPLIPASAATPGAHDRPGARP